MTTEQWTNLKFLVRLGKKPTEALKLLQDVYGDDAMSQARVFEWHRRFKEGRKDVEDDPRGGDLPRARLRLVDRRLTVRMIANELDMNCERVWTIIMKHLGMRKICAKMVPRLLNEQQKERCVQVCHDFLEELETEPNLLGRVITGDESCIFEYDPETKRQSLQWKSPTSPRPKKARMSKSKIKVMLIAFFDVRGIVHTEFMPQGHTINQHIYRDVLRRLMQSVHKKRRELYERNHGCFTMTKLLCTMPWASVNFLPKITLLCWSNLHTHQIWLPVIFSCFQSSRESWKERVFQTYKQLKEPWWRSSEQSRNNPSRSTWKHGRGGWKSALEPMGITLKAMHSSLRFAFLIKELCTQSRYFSNTPRKFENF